MKVVYVAGPLTGKDMWEVRQNVHLAEDWGMAIAELGGVPLMPTSNTEHFYGTLTPEFWYAATIELLKRCDAIFLIEGWTRSKGAVAEREEAQNLGIPIFDYRDISEFEKWLAGKDVKLCMKKQ